MRDTLKLELGRGVDVRTVEPINGKPPTSKAVRVLRQGCVLWPYEQRAFRVQGSLGGTSTRQNENRVGTRVLQCELLCRQ